MPEGDTVWLHAQRLNRVLAGQRLTASDMRLPRLATTSLTGCEVRDVTSRGKHLLFHLRAPDEREWTLRSHLRMDGTWRVFRPGERWRGRPSHTVRVVLTTEEVVAVGFHLHDVALVRREDEASLVGHLGPDLLGADWDAAEAVRRLSTQPDREIAVSLLDQRNLAGVGNFYKCEILFLRGVSPWTAVRDAGDLTAMVDLAHRLLLANRHRWAQVTTGDTRPGQGAYVFDRGGLACRRCGTVVRVSRLGDPATEDRITYWCPACQPGPVPRPSTESRARPAPRGSGRRV